MSVFRGQIRDGKVDFGSDTNALRFREWCKENPGAWIRIEHQKPVRSMSQHRYYFVYLEAISRETGNTVEALHAWAKQMFLPPRYANVFGRDVLLDATTTTLSKVEFGELIERISAATGIPPPNPQDAGYLPN